MAFDRSDAYRFAGALVVVFLAAAVDVFDFLDKGNSLRYLLLLVPLGSIALLRVRRPSSLVRRPLVTDRLLLVLLLVGLPGALYGALVSGTAATARPIFFAMTVGPLYLLILDGVNHREARQLLRAVSWVAFVYVFLNALVNTGLLGRLLVYRQFRNANLLYVAIAIAAAVVLRQWYRLVLLLGLAAVIYRTYPSGTFVLIALGTVVTLFLTGRTHARVRLLAVSVCVLAGLTLVLLNFTRGVTVTSEYFALVGKANTTGTRLALWQSGIEKFKESPLVGSMFTGGTVTTAVRTTGAQIRLPYHNDYVLFLAEGGILGFGLLVLWILATEVTAWRWHVRITEQGWGAHAGLLRVLLVGFNAFVVAAAFNPVLAGLSRAATIFGMYGLMMLVGRSWQEWPGSAQPERGEAAPAVAAARRR